MEIDLGILEQLGEYHDGEMTLAKKEELKKKLAEDDKYKYHLDIYKGIIKGIQSSTETTPKDKLFSSFSSGNTNEIIDELVRKDRSSVRWRLSSIAATLLLLIAAAFWVGQFFSSNSSQSNSVLASKDSISFPVEDEPELTFGDPGKSIIKKLIYKSWNLKTGEKKLIQKDNRTKTLVLSKGEAFIPSYRLSNDSIYLYVVDIATFNQLEIIYLEVKSSESSKANAYLEINEHLFSIYPNLDDQLLGEEIVEK